MNIRYFAGRTILITGASAGIGYEFARQLAPAVGTMLLVARRNERLEALESELKAINPKLQLFSRSLNLRDHDDLDRFCDLLAQPNHKPNFSINNHSLPTTA